MLVNYQCSEDTANLAVIDNKGKAPVEILNNLVSRVRTPVSEGPISFNHKHGLIGILCQTILLIQHTQIVQAPQKQTVYIIETTEQPEVKKHPKMLISIQRQSNYLRS